MSEFELVGMLRDQDENLTLDRPLREIAEQISSKLPLTIREFNQLAIPSAHVTEFGFCVNDFTMFPCERFRDCLNCTEQVCIKGDKRLKRIKERQEQVLLLKVQAEDAIAQGLAGADRWYQIRDLTNKRISELIDILEDPQLVEGAVVKLRNKEEFSPIKREINAKHINNSDKSTSQLIENLLGDGLG